MSVRKRNWVTSKGEAKEAWIVDYTDQNGDRHIETFERKKDADARHAVVNVDVDRGIHTPQSSSVTVAEAAQDWIAYVELEGRERSTVAQYRQHVDLHINPRLGRERVAKLTTPRGKRLPMCLAGKIISARARKGADEPQLVSTGRAEAWKRTQKRGGQCKDRGARAKKAKT